MAGPVGETDPKAQFHPRFALLIGLVAIVVTVLPLNRATSHLPEISTASWTGEAGRLAFAASLTVPALVLGGVAIGVGLWMAVVEWRGRFAPMSEQLPQADAGIDPGVLVAAIGKLQGASLVLVIGAVLLLGSVWVAASATAPAASPSPAPVVSPTPTK